MESPSRVRLVRTEELSNRAPYAYAAVARPGVSFVFTAGACPLDAAGETVGRGDIAAQAEQVMNNLRVALRAAGAELLTWALGLFVLDVPLILGFSVARYQRAD